MSPDSARDLFPIFLIGVAVLAAGADCMLWFTRRPEVPWTALLRIPGRWITSGLYTPAGNRLRLAVLVGMVVLLTGFLFWQVVLGPGPSS